MPVKMLEKGGDPEVKPPSLLPAWDGDLLVRWRACPSLAGISPPDGDPDCFFLWRVS